MSPGANILIDDNGAQHRPPLERIGTDDDGTCPELS
jgi:hypothetical protein